MELIGGIIKGTTKRVYKKHKIRRSEEHSSAIEDQSQLLYNLMTTASLTDFGIVHDFNGMLKDPDFLDQFKTQVPLTNYENFHHEWLHRSLEGRPNVIWPGKVKYFALSSGTTNAASKRIPVTETMIKQFQKTTFQQIAEVNDLDLPDKVYESSILVIGGSTRLTKVGEHMEGDLSGILMKNKSLIHMLIAKPGMRTSRIKDWNEKMEAIVNKAPKWNIGIIAGVPSWISMLFERIIERYQLESIHDIWPNLSLFVHGGVFLDPYKDRLEKCFGKKVLYQNTFLASEGYFAYQLNSGEGGNMRLLTREGVFYEFIEDQYLDQLQRKEFNDIPTLTLDQVKTGKNYTMVITTCSGLWRYLNGDVIQFTDIDNCEIKIVGRTSFSLNLAGEHLSEENMTQAVQHAAQIMGLSVQEFCVYADEAEARHNWYIGCDREVDAEHFSTLINSALILLNDDYHTARKHLLKAPKVKSMPVDRFYGFMASRNKLGGQHKFPRVMNAEQHEAWVTFLNNH